MYCIRGFKGEWKIISKDKALEYGKNRLKDLFIIFQDKMI